MARSHTPRNRCVRFVFGIAAASRNTRFQAARSTLPESDLHYRRNLELMAQDEEWSGEKEYFKMLVGKLEPNRERLGRNPGGKCIEFYSTAIHDGWSL